MDVCLYGTLRDPLLLRLLIGTGGLTDEGVLEGWTVEQVKGAAYPMAIKRSGSSVPVTLLRDVTEDQLARLDAYEIPFGYARVHVEVGGQPAWLYTPPLSLLSSGAPWDLQAWQAARGQIDRLRAAEIGSHLAPMVGDSIKRQWKQISARAASRHRAEGESAPHDVRRRAGEVVVEKDDVVAGDFFKFRQLMLRHALFRGGMSDDLSREVFEGFDATLLLPYDPATDSVLLVEQFRVGPCMRHDPNPWMLEPVVGLVDPDETPEDAARREAVEEAGITVGPLHRLFGAYPSPGTSTEFYHAFVATADLSGIADRFGGLEEEGEDIRIHVLPLERVLGMIDTGEVRILPLIAMLYWVARNRAVLRASA